MCDEEFVPEPFAGAGAAHDAGDIDHAHGSRDDFFALDELVDDIKPLIGHGHHADVGIDGGKRIIRRQRPRRRQRVKDGAFPNVRQPDNSNF